MSFSGCYDTNTTQIVTTSDHDQVTRIEFDVFTHETSWEGHVGSDFSVNLDQALSTDFLGLGHSRDLCGPALGFGANTPDNLSNIQCLGAYKRFNLGLGKFVLMKSI
ncbi:hypothetical protein BpHYR1_046065 [Brachionus plicatilis]|uniref:Uncharacterized protein n=1 Tax=Brachionus plicatilis TaxID=10195 RepID=A0A3M7SR38_BRAPC|nr:hypothetical protein BpHYR1_046065 [Brachionus plicatilis]